MSANASILYESRDINFKKLGVKVSAYFIVSFKRK